MASVTDSRRKWTCPECQRTFKIPRSSPEPDLCPACRIAETDDGIYEAEFAPMPPPRAPASPLPVAAEMPAPSNVLTPRPTARRRHHDGSAVVSVVLTVVGGVALVLGMFVFGLMLVRSVERGVGLVGLIMVSPYVIGLLVLAVLGLGLGQIVKQLDNR